MKALLQRSKESSVIVAGKKVGEIKKGFVILLGIHSEDTMDDIEYIAKKVAKIRLFSDEEGKINDDITKAGGEILLVSQFTLIADYKKGNRPSFINSMPKDKAYEYYKILGEKFENLGINVSYGEYGGDMQVNIQNDGPVTVMIDSREYRSNNVKV